MPWNGSDRRSELPDDWPDRRAKVLKRDEYRCRLLWDDGCEGTATDVDHIKRGNDHRLSNLQAACGWCHDRKSSAEGNAARKRYSKRRPKERHPGLL